MKTEKNLIKLKEEMKKQIPNLILKVGEAKDEEGGMILIAAFTSKLSIINYTLDDSDKSFKDIETETMKEFDEMMEDAMNEISKLISRSV